MLNWPADHEREKLCDWNAGDSDKLSRLQQSCKITQRNAANQAKSRTMEIEIRNAQRLNSLQNGWDELKPTKKGAWRKDFARFEDDLELKKLHKETQRKIELLDDKPIGTQGKENYMFAKTETKSSDVKLLLEDIKKRTEGKKQNSSDNNAKTTSVTSFTKQLKPQNNKIETQLDLMTNQLLETKKTNCSSGNNKHQANENKNIAEPFVNEKATKKSDKDFISRKVVEAEDSVSKSENKFQKKKEILPKSESHVTSHEKEQNLTKNSSKTTNSGCQNQEISLSLEEDDEDESGMRAMRKETDDKFSDMEAEFNAGRSKLGALREKMKKLRERTKESSEND